MLTIVSQIDGVVGRCHQTCLLLNLERSTEAALLWRMLKPKALEPRAMATDTHISCNMLLTIHLDPICISMYSEAETPYFLVLVLDKKSKCKIIICGFMLQFTIQL